MYISLPSQLHNTITFTMKTTFLKSFAIVAMTATFYAITVAFTAVGSTGDRRFLEEESATERPQSIEQWVTRQLGYPRLLDRSEEVVPVILELHVDHSGRVQILSCATDRPELAEYIAGQLNGEMAAIESSSFNRDFEIKINFRHM